MRRSLNASNLEDETALLRGLDLSELRKRWREVRGRPAPINFRRKFLIRALAYEMRVKVHGGLSVETKRRLREIAKAVRNGNEEAVFSQPRIKPGTHLIRRWQDTTHTVLIREDGYEWEGKRFSSLSAVARAITGTNWNGYAFFGLKRRSAGNKNAAGPRNAKND